MGVHDKKIVINGAVSQYDRWLRALDAEYAKVDGRSFSELLDFAVSYGSLINFYNLKNERDGDWSPFFLADPTMLLASQETIDVAEIEAEFARLERLTRAAHSFDRRFELLREIFEVILGLARRLDRWLRLLEQSAESEVMRLLRQLIVTDIERGLGEQLRRLKAYDLGAGLSDALGRPIGLDYEGFLPLWELKTVGADGAIYRGRTNNRKIAHALPPLSTILSSFLYTLSDLRLFAQAYAPATLETGDHKPQIALYMAFVRLFQTAQNSINTVSSRYTRFYYRDILRESYRAAVPDNVHLSFTLEEDEDVLSTLVPRNTLFLAGQDRDDRDILYASDKDLLVTSARLAKVRTLRVMHAKLIPQDVDSTLVVSRVLSSEIALGEPTAAQAPWATFGETQTGKTEAEITEPATLGFALASSYLWMTGGVRIVTIGLRYSSESQSKLVEMLGELSNATGLSPEKIFETVLYEAFTLYVSMSAGWFRIEKYKVTRITLDDVSNPVFELQFELPANVPPITAYDPASEEEVDDGSAEVVTDDAVVNATVPAPSLPTLKAYLRQNPVRLSGDGGTVEVYPLSLLGVIQVTAFQINADVFGLTGLQLANTDGEIDQSAPFPLFGGAPVVGSYLLIRHRELFAKRLSNLWLTITWFNLPPNEDGFQGYYKDYVIGLDGKPQCNLFNNAVFHGGLSIQNPGHWFLTDLKQCPDAPPPVPIDLLLFRTKPYCDSTRPDAALCSFTNFDKLKVCRWTPPAYYDAAESAIKLELTGPPYTFGTDLFPQNVLYSVLEDLPNTDFCKDNCLTECMILAEASECIATCLYCLAVCAQQPTPDPQCAQACLSVCLTCLSEKSAQCLAGCLDDSRGLPIEDALRRIKERLESCPGLPEPERALCIRACIELLAECLDLFPDEIPSCVVQCVKKCMTILEAISCVLTTVENCQGQTGGDYYQCLIAGLTTCKEQLDAAYALCLEICMQECLTLKKTIRYPNEPYLPQALSVTVNYSARCTSRATETEEGCGLFFHLLPFDGYQHLAPSDEEPRPLVPRFSSTGNLYIGFSALIPPQTLTLLFQLAAGSSLDSGVQLPPVIWEYLSDNRWHRLRASSIQADSTNGLQNSGIITLGLPTYDPTNNTVLPAENQWLRASVAEQPDQFPKTIAIYPHAVMATWRDNDNTGEKLAKPLPPYTITSAVEDLPFVASIIQPMASFGGRPPETASTFDVRVGERLRHKDRAILGWDYERLVLERFPTVWKTQALPGRDLSRGEVPGNVLVVVVPGPDTIGVVDSTVPAASDEMLEQIQSYLEARASPFIQLHVANPLYVRIQVSATVQFHAGSDAGTYTERLNNELVQYLSPWFYDAERAARGGRYISEADISEFIQTRPYVEAMSSIKLEYEPAPQILDWYFLTSARQHKIQVA